MSLHDAAVAAARFGLGARSNELRMIAGDPRGWVTRQFGAGVGGAEILADVPSGADRLRETVGALQALRDDPDARQQVRRMARQMLTDDIGRRVSQAIVTETPVLERLVQFWSNHFTVSALRPQVVGVVLPYELEAIRPHVLGRFRTLLGAAIRHPAMLLYLDNAQSVGPNSVFGRRRERGLNENLARELLELHTLGVDGGYGQDDVGALARILTGWSIARPAEANPGTFRFRPFVHEPGDKTLLGQRIAEAGEAEGEAALDLLARHPSTARHLAGKLARHFADDDPPVALVDRLAAAYRENDGDLSAMYAVLVDAPEVWDRPLTKVRTPNDLVLAAGRALDVRDPEPVAGSLYLMGQVPFTAPSPAGWPDRAGDWIGPEAMLQRADWAMAVGRRVGRGLRPTDLLERTVGPMADPQARFLVDGAPSPADGIALVLMSPAFQRR